MGCLIGGQCYPPDKSLTQLIAWFIFIPGLLIDFPNTYPLDSDLSGGSSIVQPSNNWDQV